MGKDVQKRTRGQNPRNPKFFLHFWELLIQIIFKKTILCRFCYIDFIRLGEGWRQKASMVWGSAMLCESTYNNNNPWGYREYLLAFPDHFIPSMGKKKGKIYKIYIWYEEEILYVISQNIIVNKMNWKQICYPFSQSGINKDQISKKLMIILGRSLWAYRVSVYARCIVKH